jgi:hypothetical protein
MKKAYLLRIYYYILNLFYFPNIYMQSSEKTKKIHLGPLNLTKTNYKPYFGSLPNKRKK